MLRSPWGFLLLIGCAGVGEVDRLQTDFGLGLDRDSVHAAAQSHCARVDTVAFTAAQAAPYSRQEQINCFGYELFGKKRKLELLVNEGRLGFYWAIIEKEELGPVRHQLEAILGDPLCDNPEYVIYKGERVALRFEPAEILVGVPEDLRAITGGCS